MSGQGAGERFDLVIRGGEVLDPGAGIQGRFDLGIRDGRVAAIEPEIDLARAERVIDATGQIVTPGLVDLHTHIYWGATYWGIEADPVAARSGVTTWLDVGSAGAYSFPGFRRYIAEPSRCRVFALLNLSSIGLIAPTWEFANPDYWDVDLAAKIVEANRDLILGIKARIDRNTTRGVGVRPLERARELADRVGLPLMVHVSWGPPTIDEVAAYLRPGDILTHCFTGGDMRILGEDGRVLPVIRDLQERGLILDIGHGTGSFSFAVAEAMLEQGVLPDTISSDIHQLAVQGPMYDLPTTLSKFLALGMSLPEVIERATARPAAAIRRPDLGTLRVGSVADIALWRLEEGDFVFHDVGMDERRGTQRLVNTLTLVDGQVLPRLPERPPHVWAVLPEHQRR
ncbi:amidohydrolase/deacetylase family metallohydrolase [Sphaerobacter thermophilus]|uniref:Amidohydrolase n=1 Tax=Sphaerobacter thermophilus (strain ATCC 49802 / DSM 20745 / KCCM 41009 / NCIMB 13125 / S 6022) TaxID=479434 RepID=D1CAN0_SPHTD|nr:amidohydrolase/deacetylase family metallohydrolase [Sphaerobacter thermophilus]ACZ40873.1 amidohydrolase [Sphaerobacter thermophilus DSM 20745]